VSEVSAEGSTLIEVLDSLDASYPGIKGRVLDDSGELRRFVNVYVDDDDVRFADGHDVVAPVRPDTIARSLAIGNPADGPYVLDIARRTGGAVEDVTDDEVRAGIMLLARTEGIFAETAGGVTVATLKKLIATGQLDPEAETVIINSGDGLKTLDAVADRVGPKVTIPASYDAFVKAGLQ